MSNVYVPTKAGELLRLKEKLANAGFVVPPTRVIMPPFASKQNEIREAMTAFKDVSNIQGPYTPGLMVRNNGSPRGTGEGRSCLAVPDKGISDIIELMDYSLKSDSKSQGVILQPAVGQVMGSRSFAHYFPLLSGIAYTSGATERGNAIIEWVPGSPIYAVNGLGNYVSFTAESMKSEMKGVWFSDWNPQAEGSGFLKCSNVYISYLTYSDGRFSTAGGQRLVHTIDELQSLKSDEKKAMLKVLFKGVLALKDPLYLEWAITCIQGKVDLFALQVAEVSEKLAGLPTWLYHSLKNIDKMLKGTDAAWGDSERFKSLYSAALEDKQAIAAGFDVVGKGRQEFKTVLWKPETADCSEDLDGSVLVALDSSIMLKPFVNFIQLMRVSKKIGGVVELDSGRDGQSFRAHVHGFCSDNGILGLGGVKNMEKKLLAFLPEQYAHFGESITRRKSRLLMRGKFVLEVDESVPFGTLKVERIDSVEKLAD